MIYWVMMSILQRASDPMRVAIMDATKSLLSHQFSTESLGNVLLKGKGEMSLHFVQRL